MFSIGDKVIDRTGKIFVVESVVSKDFGNGPSPYLVLRPYFDAGQSPAFRSFVPVDRSEQLLHGVMSKEDCLALIGCMDSLPVTLETSPRARKELVSQVVSKGDRKEILRAIRSFEEYKASREREKKPFSDTDKRLLSSLETVIQDEMSVVLNIPREKLPSFIAQVRAQSAASK